MVARVGIEGDDLRALVDSATAWWRDAGVDVIVDDVARDWLAPPPRPAAAAPAASDATANATGLPATLDAFLAMRGGDDAPEVGWGARVRANGDPASSLMVLADMPDADDRDTLFTGAAAPLFDAMLRAIGHTRDDVYLAALCHARAPGGEVPASAQAMLATLARHHVTLAAPKRLLLLGRAASRALLAVDGGGGAGRLHRLKHDGTNTVAIATFAPRFLLERRAAKAETWRHLQMLMGETV